MGTFQDLKKLAYGGIPSVPWNVGVMYSVEPSGVRVADDTDYTSKQPTGKQSIVVRGNILQSVTGYKKTGPVTFNPGDEVELWFSEGSKAAVVIDAMTRAGVQDLVGGVFTAGCVSEVPSQQGDPRKILAADYVPPAGGLSQQQMAQLAGQQPQQQFQASAQVSNGFPQQQAQGFQPAQVQPQQMGNGFPQQGYQQPQPQFVPQGNVAQFPQQGQPQQQFEPQAVAQALQQAQQPAPTLGQLMNQAPANAAPNGAPAA